MYLNYKLMSQDYYFKIFHQNLSQNEMNDFNARSAENLVKISSPVQSPKSWKVPIQQ